MININNHSWPKEKLEIDRIQKRKLEEGKFYSYILTKSFENIFLNF